MSDTCIKDNGQIVLFSVVGCSTGVNEPNDKLFGLWEMANGKKEIVCWQYKDVILVYTLHNKIRSYLPNEQTTECPLHPSSKTFSIPESKSPAMYIEPISG